MQCYLIKSHIDSTVENGTKRFPKPPRGGSSWLWKACWIHRVFKKYKKAVIFLYTWREADVVSYVVTALSSSVLQISFLNLMHISNTANDINCYWQKKTVWLKDMSTYESTKAHVWYDRNANLVVLYTLTCSLMVWRWYREPTKQ